DVAIEIGWARGIGLPVFGEGFHPAPRIGERLRDLGIRGPAVRVDAHPRLRKLNRAATLAAAALEGVERRALAVRNRVRSALIAFGAHAEIDIEQAAVRQIAHIA